MERKYDTWVTFGCLQGEKGWKSKSFPCTVDEFVSVLNYWESEPGSWKKYPHFSTNNNLLNPDTHAHEMLLTLHTSLSLYNIHQTSL